jgi:putative multiple sugar transport system substrate-binding protein
VQQAESLVAGLKERFGDVKPWNVELFGGSPDDNNAFFFYDGAMSVLQPLIDAGDIVIPSGQMGMDVVGTLRWDGAVAQARMDNLLSSNYGDKQLHGALSPYDGLSIGILSSLKGVGYGSGDLKMPIVTGQDAEVPSVKSMIAGEQYSTVFKDTRELAKVTVGMVDAVLSGGEPEINDTSTYDNGVKVVPSYLLEPVSVDVSNYEESSSVRATTPRTSCSKLIRRACPRRSRAGRSLSGGDMSTLLEMREITKVFPGVKALDRVSLTVEPAKSTPSAARTAPANPP